MRINRLNNYQLNLQNKFQNRNQNNCQAPSFGKLIAFENDIGNKIHDYKTDLQTKLTYSKLLETLANNEAIKKYAKKHDISIKLDNFEYERSYSDVKTTVKRGLGINIIDHELEAKIIDIKSKLLCPKEKIDNDLMERFYKEADNLNKGTIFNFIAKGKSYEFNKTSGMYEFPDGLKAIKDSLQNLSFEKLEKNRLSLLKKIDKLNEKIELTTNCRYEVHKSKNIRKSLDEINSWKNIDILS